jgi:3-hydroxyisobutyrate dehydrogenase
MSDTISSVGFIGLGDMGSKQVREIAKLPIALTVFDARPEAVKPFEGRAALATSIGELGKTSDLVCICVQDDAQVEACADQLLPVMRAGSVILIHATVAPETVRSIADRASGHGIHVMDAPVARTRMTDDGPFVFCPVGGDEALLARVKPVLESFATDILLAGPTGAGMALKICNNLASWCEIIVGLEVVRLAQAADVPIDGLLRLMESNGVLTPPMRIFAGLHTRPPEGDQWRQSLAIHAAIGEKDLKLAEQLAERTGSPSPLASFLRSTVRDDVLKVGHR